VTRRAWLILFVGIAAAAASAGLALAQRRSTTTLTPTASWSMYRPTQWQRLVRRTGLAGVHVVSATAKRNGTPVALLAGTRGAATCFVPAVATTLGRTVCRPSAPLTLFHVRDGAFTDVLGIAGPGVAGVAETVRLDGRRQTSGLPLLPVGRYFAFGGGAGGDRATVVAHDARGRELARISIR